MFYNIYIYITYYPVSNMFSFPNCYARKPLDKIKLDCNHIFAITVMHQYSDYKLRV